MCLKPRSATGSMGASTKSLNDWLKPQACRLTSTPQSLEQNAFSKRPGQKGPENSDTCLYHGATRRRT
nr:MAG TPA: hypothetical protein [Caudoviricetes sp.]DAK77151.1 MAG TPA: hypothetical protein [Caudoviricetes sp.]